MKLIHREYRSTPIEWERDNERHDQQKSIITQKASMDDSIEEEQNNENSNNSNVQNKGDNKMEKKTRLASLAKSSAKNSTIMSDTQKINTWIDFGQSVLLIGPSGIGKTQRITDAYKDRVVYLKLTNNMLPEKVVGSTNLATGQEIPPNFLKQIILMCATDEEKALIEKNVQNIYKVANDIYERSKKSDEKIVLLLDELLNVKPAIQALVYSIVLNKRVEIGQGIKLPKNVVVVATGNPKKYSAAAEDLAEPLQKRFDHILNMQPKVSEWIYDYALPRNIHPTVIAYIFSKFQASGKDESIESIGYFYEEPEIGESHPDAFGQNGKTNDPRSWESVSSFLYDFEESLKRGDFDGMNVEDFLKKSLESRLRSEWASEFFNFYNIPTLTVEDVVTKNYTAADAPQTSNEMFALLSSLIQAKPEDLQACRQYILNTCGPEYLSIFDINWVRNDEDRLLVMADLPELSYTNQKQEKTAVR